MASPDPKAAARRMSGKKVLLLSPPVVQPIAPFLALPSLTAHLKALGHDVVQRDLNVEFFHWLHDGANAASLVHLSSQHGMTSPSSAGALRAKLSMLPVLYGRLRGRDIYREPGGILTGAYQAYCEFERRPPESAEAADQQIRFWEQVFVRLAADPAYWQGYDLIGVSIFADTQIIPARALARRLRKMGHKGWIIAGGGVFSEIEAQQPEALRDYADFDGIVFYEGEKVLEDLLADMDHPEQVSNLLYWGRDGVQHAPRMVRSDFSMNDLPAPCFEGLPLDRYAIERLVLPISATRACYWNKCVFCTLSERTSGGVFRQRSAASVVEDIATIKRCTGARAFRFIDDSIPPRLMREIVEGFHREELGVDWACHLNVDDSYLKAGFPRRLREAGCRLVSFGLESASPRVRALILKDPPRLAGIEVLSRLMPALQEAGIRIGLSVIIGLPTETREEALATVRYLRENRRWINFLALNRFNLQRSSAIYARPELYGLRIDPSHPRGFHPSIGMSHEEVDQAFFSLRDETAAWAASDPAFSTESAVLPQALVRVCNAEEEAPGKRARRERAQATR